MSKKIAVLIESDFFEKEIFYYQMRFPEADCELHLFSRLWGQSEITFTGHEYKVPLVCNKSFEEITDQELASFDALIVPSGIVADRLRYTDDINKLPPACLLLERAFAMPNLIKGIICHGMWLMAPIAHLIEGRKGVVHNNLLGDARAYGLQYEDQDVVVDGDLVTARTGMHCHLFAKQILQMIETKENQNE